MINVKVRGLRVGVAGASSVIALGGASSGCAADEAFGAHEATGESLSAFTTSNPGAARLELAWQWSASGAQYATTVTGSTTDEFVRVGETLTLAVPAYVMWNSLYPNDGAPETTRLQELRVRVRAVFFRAGTEITTRTVTSRSFTGDNFYSLLAITGGFVVPRGVDTLKLDFTFTDAKDASKLATLGVDQTTPVAIFGASLPEKTVLFDNSGTDRRQRVVEGGSPVAASDALLSYTDWRANTVVDTYSIDRQIGMVQGFGRFGPYPYPIYGDLVHEVSYGVYFDDGKGWRPEAALAPNAASPLVPASRVAYEGKVRAPSRATRMSVYFHVKTYLVVDYSKWQSVTERRYNQGDRILVRERWDNPNGPNTNYDFTLETP